MLKITTLISIFAHVFIGSVFAFQPINIPNDQAPQIPITPLIYTAQEIPIIERLKNPAIKDSQSNLSWEASYEAVLSNDQSTIDLSGFITLHNKSEQDFINKTIQFAVEPSTPAINILFLRGCMTHDQKRLYHIFQLPNKMDLMRGQTKITPFLSVQNVPITNECRIIGSLDQDNPIADINCFYHIDRDALKVATPLPNGTFQIYHTLNDGSEELIQEVDAKNISQTNNYLAGQKYISLNVGNNSNISIKQFISHGKILPDASYLFKHQIILANPTNKDIVINYFLEETGGFELSELSHPIEMQLPFYTRNNPNQSDVIAWRITIPAKGETNFSYTAKLK